jgi:hypothetical protein
MNPIPSPENDEQDGDKLLKSLGSLQVPYPIELLNARRAAYLAQVERLTAAEPDEELSTADQEIVTLLETAKSIQAGYPSKLLAARLSAFVRQIKLGGHPSVRERFRLFIQRIFQTEAKNPTLPSTGFMRLSLIVASLVAALFLGSSWFARAQALFTASLSQIAVTTPTAVLPASTEEAAITICGPNDHTPACLPGELDPRQNLADPGQGAAWLVVSKDAYPAHQAKYVNDGRGDTSWVSNSADSWIKLDLGQVRTINVVSLEKSNLAPFQKNDLGSFEIAVALSDVYADGDSSNDYREYAPVFRSDQASFSGIDSQTEMITTRFSSVEARFVKITFKRAGAAIKEIGVFMVEPPVLAKRATRVPHNDLPGITLIPINTNTLMAIDTSTSLPTNAPTNTQTPTNTPYPSDTPTVLPTQTQTPTNTPYPSDTPTVLPTQTQPPVDTATPEPPDSLSTEVPPTAIQTAVQLSSITTESIVVTQSDQTLTLTCNGNTAEIRGHANTITLLGSCSSITVTGNGNRVFWQSGSPVITTKGQDNIVRSF